MSPDSPGFLLKLEQRFGRQRLLDVSVYLPAAVLSGIVAWYTLRTVLARTGHPAVPLDDSFIHFQYARNLASGHFFTYAPGDAFTAGATSFAWPALLALFHLVGFRGLSLIWPAWILGFLAHAALVVEAYRLSTRLTGKPTAWAVAAMTALFGPFAWFAASGMEAIPLAWLIARTARVAAEWCEGQQDHRTRARRTELLVLAVVAPLMRPEGMLASAFASVALAAFPLSPAKRPWRERAWALLPWIGPAIIPLVTLLFTGQSSSNTAMVKWLPLSPYHATWPVLWSAIRGNLTLLFTTLFNGEQWSLTMVPKNATPFFVAALCAIPIAGWRYKQPWRAAFVLMFACGLFAIATYNSFLWNRLRYLWPFFPAWFVGFGCLSRLVADTFAQLNPRWLAFSPVACGVAAGWFANGLSWSMDNVAESASAIDRQQVKLGAWARDNLPANAIIGVNDTGAIAYVSGLYTFDVVGLTTAGESKYWAHGPGSRFEHYERLVRSAPHRFPTHFIVYQQWMACDPVLGRELFEAVVTDQSILGGTRMTVFEARKDLLGSGDKPVMIASSGDYADSLDVADLESEKDHGYEVFQAGLTETSNRVHKEYLSDDGEEEEELVDLAQQRAFADGGRFERTWDRFFARLPAGKSVRGIARLVGGTSGATVTVSVAGSVVVTLSLPSSRAKEYEFVIPAAAASDRTPVELRALQGNFGALHYWFEKTP